MRAVPEGLAAAATAAGVQFRYGSTVTRLERSGSRVTAVCTDSGDRIACDAVVLTTELPLTYQLLGRTPHRPIKFRPSPSCVVMHVGVPSVGDALSHHNISFGAKWSQTFDEIIRDGVLMSDPSLLVTMPTAGDLSLAPEGRDLLFVLAPCPNLEAGPAATRVNWAAQGDSYARQVLATAVERLLPDIGSSVLADADILDVVTPADWARQGMTAGSPFALAHTFSQTGPFRPANLVRGVDNAVLAGGSTVPGVGVPTALLSGRLAAERVAGPIGDHSHRRTITGAAKRVGT
jgi:phytoene desaturase